MAKGCVYILQSGKDAGKIFGSKDSLAAHMNYTPAMADLMAKYEKTGGKMDAGNVTKWLTDNGYLKAEAKKPTTTGEDIKSFFSNIGNQSLAIMEADILKAGKSVISNISKATSEQRKKIDADIEQLKNKYPERNITSKVENGNLIVESGVAAPKTTQKPTTKKEFPKAPVTDAVKAALKSVDNTTVAIMNLAKVLPTVYESITKQVKTTLGKPVSQQVAEAYHNAVENGVEPELVAAVENAVALQEQMKSKPSLADDIETAETLEMDGVPNGVRVSNKSSLADLERKHAGNATKKATIAMARAAAKTLKSVFPMMDIHLHENTSDYNNAMANLGAQQNSAGNFTYSTSSDGTVVGRIDINLNRAVPRTVVHEVSHAIMLKTFGDSSPAFLEFRNNLEKIISKSGNARLSAFADKYKDIADDIGQAEEYLAELAGILSDKEAPLSYGVIRRIAEMINKAVSTITFGRIKPFEDLQNQKETLEFFNSIAQSIKTGSSLENLMTAEPYSTSIAIEVDPDGTFTKSSIKTKAAIGDYIIPKGKKDLAIATVPTKSLAEVIKEYNGRVVIITSDATGYGVDSKGREIYGGPGFANNLKNVLDEIGFASLNIGTVKSTYTAAENIYGQGKTLVLIMVQPPHTTINNSYGTRYFMESLVKIAKNKDWQDVKNDIKTRISTLNKITNEIGDENVAKMMAFFDKINSKSDPDALTEEYLNFTTFPARSVIAKTLMFDHPGKGVSVNTAKSKLAFLDIGVTIYDFLKEYGDQTILTEDMMREDIGGFVVAGFEIDVTDKDTREKLIVETQGKGIAHPLFNAKLPGTNHFVLDGLYGVNENFARFSKTNTEIALPTKERDQMVREIYTKTSNYAKPIQSKINAIAQDPALSDEEKNAQIEKLKIYTNLSVTKKVEFKEKYLSKIKGALVTVMPNVATSVAQGIGFIPEKGAEKRIEKAEYTKSRELPPSKIANKAQIAINEYEEAPASEKPVLKSKAQLAVFDETGYVSTEFWVNNLSANTKYLDGVIKSILDARSVLKKGKVKPEQVVKAYMITLGSMGSGGTYYDSWKEKTGQTVSDLFLEKEKGRDWLRPEGAAAAYLVTDEGKKVVDDMIAGTASAVQIKKLFDFIGVGRETQKAGYAIKSMQNGGIKAMTDTFNENKGKDFAQLYQAAMDNLEGIGEGKTGFFNQYFGVSGRAVIDARELNAWIAGSMKLTPEQTRAKEKAASSKAIGDMLLKRIEEVGLKLGYSADMAGYIAHHAIWDAVKGSVTTHEGEYAVVSGKAPIKSKVSIKSKAQIFGETGATRMENAEKVLDNLQVARDMEAKFEKEERTMRFVGPSKSAENAQKIRLATGWEKGADGMWRLEIPDGQLKPIDLDNMYKDGGVPKAYLDEIYDSKELYEAYPTARDLRVSFIEADDYKGSYNQKEGQIELAINNFDEPMDMLSTLLHEVQHHIQYVEGFATGSNTSTVVNKIMSEIQQINRQIDTVKKEKKEPGADVGKLQEKQAVLENKSKRLNEKVSESIMGAMARMNVELKGPEEQRAFVNLALKDRDVQRELYIKVAGEVEARNVQKRMGLSEEERMNKLLSSTEDVHRSDQLALGAALKGETPTLKSKAQMAPVEETAKALDEVGEATVKAKIDSLSESLKKSFDQQKAKIEALGNASTDKDLESYTNLKSASRQIDRVAKYGSFPIGYDTIRDEFSDVDKQIEKPEAKYKNGKQIGKEDFGKTYEVEGSGLLYRGVSKADYERINKQGFIDTDMRGAISRREGMNLAKDPATSASYLPNNAGGYVIAINPKGLNLFGTDADNYIRTRDVVPIENIVKVSEYIAKDDMGSFFMDSKLNESISNAYYKAKEDGSNPELVKAVEDLIGKPGLKTKAQMVDNNAKEVADLYAEMREGGGWAERQKINAILDQDPKLSYIYNNFKAITQMLEDAKLLTKSGNCP